MAKNSQSYRNAYKGHIIPWGKNYTGQTKARSSKGGSESSKRKAPRVTVNDGAKATQPWDVPSYKLAINAEYAELFKQGKVTKRKADGSFYRLGID